MQVIQGLGRSHGLDKLINNKQIYGIAFLDMKYGSHSCIKIKYQKLIMIKTSAELKMCFPVCVDQNNIF